MNYAELDNQWVVLWSPHQKQFHIETFGSMLQTNRRIFQKDQLGDYILLHVAATSEEAAQITEKLQPMAEGREFVDRVASKV